MGWLRTAFDSTIGMKWLMGLTGIGLALFVLAHMIGNLQVFLGPDALNTYAENMQNLGPLLWLARLGLLAIVVLHIVSAVRLTQLNKRARPHAYAVITPQVSSYASRTMFMGGLILAAFIVYHLLHFTIGVTDPKNFALHDAQGRHDVYGMLVMGFRNPLVAGFYLLAMIPLLLHLQHGVSSFFQTVGMNFPQYNRLFRAAGPLLSTLIFIGNCAIVLAAITGMLPYPVAGH